MDNLRKIDHSALKVNQLVIITLNLLAFIFNLPGLVVLVAAVMLIGTLLGAPGFGFGYHKLLKPAGWIKPDVLLDNPEPHRFAQGLGGVFMSSAALALFLGAGFVGWGLVWLVAGLAALNAFGGFCLGCMVYYWLSRLRVPGFYKSPPADTFPGMRPNTRVGQER
ncbi:MAG: hypothetical protein B6D39_01820 [Anaerolineae bacterium UTCFX2]|mgnify:CR=1 FL=1|jgi:hypothetical protein|nr:DUF4395 domain-containing protein [Anaerolineae bacterium]MCZ7552701.1 DUF4395 domain-containing protein [Anaerolineales bacterium]OQY94243.1 MAG: hypothetical protein B6D39_01820 [Anaerolineae bacterium UTCFX2]